ncbi:hypothetical protein JCM21142_41498 [Saccharicrinis fermentans DSM 9555 = JCM 21142]|uniref:Uncharacterized protein n=1 Tax=Saccharicrinis fermentans DSM 9555 = JCM 21142 TaxID=869213 RepID=W7Y5K4_9BACT|nr:hypothetical protein JCM21142_41498 [Saccharicrinis fermentans DSM 9555 = JCM 21142]
MCAVGNLLVYMEAPRILQFFLSLRRKIQRQGFDFFLKARCLLLINDCFKNEHNVVFGVSCKDYIGGIM